MFLSPDLLKELPGLPQAVGALRGWIEAREFSGYEPFDLLNSPYLRGAWARRPFPGILLIQAGKRFAGPGWRRFLKVPPSRNPKALALCLSAYCDLARAGHDVVAQVRWLKEELIRLRSPGEADYCWGYDWDYLSLRGSRLPAFSANCIATYFCASALLQVGEVFADPDAVAIAESAGRFAASRLQRSFESADEVCFSYTPNDRTVIYNSSALTAVLLARVGKVCGHPEYLDLARKAMAFLVRAQLPGGGWYYGALRRQRWIDGFHSSYNVCALLNYQQVTGDERFTEAMMRGHHFYQRNLFADDGAPKYFHDQIFPIDIHSCSQAILHFVAFASVDAGARERALRSFDWTISHMAAEDGSFFYQRHRMWTNRTPYMRWGQAWMFHALTRLLAPNQTRERDGRWEQS